jgi:predicted site-specific integrase-resolvase
MSKQTITPKELAQRRGISLDFIYRQLWAGKISGAQKDRKRWVIPAEAAQPRRQNA